VIDPSEPHGAVSTDGHIAGAYVHGLVQRGEARAAMLASFGVQSVSADHRLTVEAALDEIASMLEASLDIEAISAIAGLNPWAAA
jgi:adenosylcobyric acid synthase